MACASKAGTTTPPYQLVRPRLLLKPPATSPPLQRRAAPKLALSYPGRSCHEARWNRIASGTTVLARDDCAMAPGGNDSAIESARMTRRIGRCIGENYRIGPS